MGAKLLLVKDMRNAVETLATREEFECWAFTFEAVYSELGWKDMVEQAIASPTVIDAAALGPAAGLISRNLYALLANRARTPPT